MAKVVNEKLVAQGGLRIPAGAGAGLLAQSDAAGNVSWAAASGPSVLKDEQFTSSPLGSYTAIDATSLSGLTVSGGVLGSSDSAFHEFKDGGVTVSDARHIVKCNILSASAIFRLFSKVVAAASTWLLVSIQGGNVTIYQRLSGTETLLDQSPFSFGTLAAFWLIMEQVGNVVWTELWTVDPRVRYGNNIRPTSGGIDPVYASRITLAGASATALGAGVSGNPGLGFGNAATTDTMDDWVIVDRTPSSLPRGSF